MKKEPLFHNIISRSYPLNNDQQMCSQTIHLGCLLCIVSNNKMWEYLSLPPVSHQKWIKGHRLWSCTVIMRPYYHLTKYQQAYHHKAMGSKPHPQPPGTGHSCHSPPVPRTFRSSKFSMPTLSTWPVRLAAGVERGRNMRGGGVQTAQCCICQSRDIHSITPFSSTTICCDHI